MIEFIRIVLYETLSEKIRDSAEKNLFTDQSSHDVCVLIRCNIQKQVYEFKKQYEFKMSYD